MSERRSMTSIAVTDCSPSDRDSLWVFRKLWIASRRRSAREFGNPLSPGPLSLFEGGIKFNVAPTVLFDNELRPQSWLITTSQGRLRGLTLALAHGSSQHSLRVRERQEIVDTIYVMQHFWEHVNHGHHWSDDGPTCIVSAPLLNGHVSVAFSVTRGESKIQRILGRAYTRSLPFISCVDLTSPAKKHVD